MSVTPSRTVFTTEDAALGAYCRAAGLILIKVVADEARHRCAMVFDDPEERAADLAREFAHRPDLHAFFKANRDLVIAFGIAKNSPERWCSRALLDAIMDERQQRRREVGRPGSTDVRLADQDQPLTLSTRGGAAR